MNVVLVSNLYPNSNEPTRGIYTQQLVHQLQQHVNIRVVAPTAWRPRALLKTPLPRFEHFNGVDVWHPSYVVIPKTARWTYGYTFFLGVYSTLKKLHEEKPIDLINVHWAYPDAVGVVMAARRLGLPVAARTSGSLKRILTGVRKRNG